MTSKKTKDWKKSVVKSSDEESSDGNYESSSEQEEPEEQVKEEQVKEEQVKEKKQSKKKEQVKEPYKRREPYNRREREPYNGREREPYNGREREPYNGREREPYNGREREPYNGRERQVHNNNPKPRQRIEDIKVDLDKKLSEVGIKDLLIRVAQLGEQQCNPTARFGAIKLIRTLEGDIQRPSPPQRRSYRNKHFDDNPRMQYGDRRNKNEIDRSSAAATAAAEDI